MIEASSPLAAMQPPAFMGHCGFRKDPPPCYASLAAVTRTFGTGSFNFRDLSMKASLKKSHLDYFSVQPVRGSSPTASLAADLSQNCHIDQSPQFPTPRRSLFPSATLTSYQLPLSTPPIPPSSPAGINDGMDMSPLPHKLPYGTTLDLQLRSPTPDPTPNPIPSPAESEPAVEMTLTIPPERRRSGPLRPSLSKPKCPSTTSLPPRLALESQNPPFKFGSGISRSNSSSLSLSEIFNDSPVQEKPTSRFGPPISSLAQRRPPLAGCLKNGSPIATHARKSSNPLIRPRKQFRRSLSMYEHPDDVMKQDKEPLQAPVLPSIMDTEVHHVPQLPNFTSDDQAGDLPRITKETMIDVLDGKYNNSYEKLLVIDCRFEYEFNGGHIDGAVNFNDKEKLAAQLFDVEPTQKALIVFHCEYSAHRAPLMAKFIRNKDRMVNAERYPHLTYPEAYILDGGYSSFFKDHSSRCFPQNYVEMDAQEHVAACERGLGKVKQRSKLIRAQTFAFGQYSPSLDSSPTTMGRNRLDSDTDMDMGLEYTPAAHCRPGFDSLRRGQRMFSY